MFEKMKTVILGLFLMIPFSVAIAQTDRRITGPISEPITPAVQCPAIGEEYEKMVAQLENIKTSIKDTANCKNVTMQVDDLKKLLDTDRAKVQAILDKAQANPSNTATPAPGTTPFPGTAPVPGAPPAAPVQISGEDAQILRAYSEAMTKKVAGLMDIFVNSNQCFQEDTQPNRIGMLAGLVGDASSLVGTVAGPYGVPIALAGNLIAGFMAGLQDVLNSRAGYDFNKRTDWANYVQNLCTYHSFRDQIDHLLSPGQRSSEITRFNQSLEKQISQMSKVCPECQQMENNFQPNANPDQAIAANSGLVKAANSRFSVPIGSYMLQSLGLRDWIRQELDRMARESAGEWGSASGQYVLIRAKESIEDFLIRMEAPKFLQFQTTQALTDYNEFLDFSSSEGRNLYQAIQQLNPKVITQPIGRMGWSYDPLAYFNSLILSPLNWDILPQNDSASDLLYSWNHFKANSLLNLHTSETTARVALSFCAFFRRTNQYNSTIRSICTAKPFKGLIENYTAMEAKLESNVQTKQDVIPAGLSEYFIDRDPKYSENSIEALIRTVEERKIPNQ